MTPLEQELYEALKGIVTDTENWNSAVEKIIGRVPNTNIGLEKAKIVIAKTRRTT